MDPIIDLEEVSFGYGRAPVLKDINLHLHHGQFAAVVGPSGAGKTTLLKIVLGVLTPTTGTLRLGAPARGPGNSIRIGYVPQLKSVDWQFPINVEQVVLMGSPGRRSLRPWASRGERQQMLELLERMEIDHLLGRHIRDLSGGQQQRVFLARALMANPDLLVLDEPTAGVDMRTAERVLHLLSDLNHQGTTILLSTHDLNSAAAHVPWVICLNQIIVAEGAPERVFTEPILNETYRADMIVLRQDGLLFVQQKPHHHTYHDVIPDPVPGHGRSDHQDAGSHA